MTRNRLGVKFGSIRARRHSTLDRHQSEEVTKKRAGKRSGVIVHWAIPAMCGCLVGPGARIGSFSRTPVFQVSVRLITREED